MSTDNHRDLRADLDAAAKAVAAVVNEAKHSSVPGSAVDQRLLAAGWTQLQTSWLLLQAALGGVEPPSLEK